MPAKHTFADVVESCLVIDIVAIGPLHDLETRAGAIRWSFSHDGTDLATIRYSMSPGFSEAPELKLCYRVSEPVTERIPLLRTRPHYGGQRWWLACPLARNGAACGARCRKLYLPPGELYFGCLKCHDLTFQSCRDSHKYGRLSRTGRRRGRRAGAAEPGGTRAAAT